MATSTNPPTVPGSQSRWEAAFERFETQAQEIEKFRRRLADLGAASWPRDAQIVDLFCGRGTNLIALQQLGFTRLEGVDLSPNLIARYSGPATLHCHDCRHLPFPDASRDILMVQGGLHHLPALPDDLDLTLQSVRRVLRPGGRFVVVEPWLTPFLRAVHFAAFLPPVRRLSGKFDALATMIEEERQTYEQWLAQPAKVREVFARHFTVERWSTGWGKLRFIGRRPS